MSSISSKTDGGPSGLPSNFQQLRKDVLIKLNTIQVEVNAYTGHGNDGKIPRYPNVKVDPVARAVAAEVIFKYNPVDWDEFKQRLMEHLRHPDTRPPKNHIGGK